MPHSKKRRFGPLFYSTLVIGTLTVLVTRAALSWPKVRERLEVQRLANALHAGDPRAQADAATALSQKDPELALPHLIRLARGPDEPGRVLACRLLGTMFASPVVVRPVLIQATTDSRMLVRFEAASVLGRDISVEWGAIRGTSPNDPRRRLHAASVEALRGLLKDPETEVRVKAATGLAASGPDPGTSQALVQATNDDDLGVRIAAATGLIKLNGSNDPVAINTLLALLPLPELVGRREEVLNALKDAPQSVQARAVGSLVEMLSSPDRNLRYDAITCLPVLGQSARSALPELERLAKDQDPHLRVAACQAIVALKGETHPKSIAILIRMIADPGISEEQRLLALESVMAANPPALARATPMLISQLNDPQTSVRVTASFLLSGIVSETRAMVPERAEQK